MTEFSRFIEEDLEWLVPLDDDTVDDESFDELVISDEEAGHPFRGNQWTGGISGLTLQKDRTFKGDPVPTRKRLTNQETDALAEEIVREYGKAVGVKDIRSTNVKGNNYPIDLLSVKGRVGIELKAGQVSNGRSAQQWNVKLGTPGPSEQKLLDRMSPEKKRAHNEKKMQAAMDRKKDALREQSRKSGVPLKAMTVGVIINPDKKTADIFAFGGFHRRIGWRQPQVQQGYLATVKYRGKR